MLLVIVLFCTSCSKLEATTMSLAKTEGSVEVSTDEGEAIAPKEGLKLYSGYGMITQEVSYAWINLDNVKLVKMDEESEIDIQKNGKNLEVMIDSGSLFFNVTEPLEEDETMDIRTSTMTVGIRGTCGWVDAKDENDVKVYILEGTVSVTAVSTGEEVLVSAGEMAEIKVNEDGEVEITVRKFTVPKVPEFVLSELTGDEPLAEAILEASGLDVLNPPAMTEVAREAYEDVLAEYRELPYINSYDGTWDQINWDAYQYVNDHLDLYNGDDSAYAYYDLNGDGVEELFIGSDWGNGYEWNAVYTFDGTDAVYLVAGPLNIILADGTVLACGNGGGIHEVYRMNADSYTLETVADPDFVLYDSNDESTWAASDVFSQDLSSHGGMIDELLEWNTLNGGSDFAQAGDIDFNDYVGNYVNDETGETLHISQKSNGTGYYMGTPRPGDPSHDDMYDLETADGTFRIVSWQTGETIMILTPQDGELNVESRDTDGYMDYLVGQYRQR